MGDPDNPDPFVITPRGDPTVTLAEMVTRKIFDSTVHSLGTGTAPCLNGIPNKIIKSSPMRPTAPSSPSTPSSRTNLTPLRLVPQHHLLTTQKDYPTLLDNYRPIALMNNLLELLTSLIEDAGSKYAKTHGILSE
jgi:hypothetical protein